jgi:hypothetical protein
MLDASGLVYAQMAQAASVSSYLIAFRAMQLISELAQAPLYSKLPLLARMRSQGRFTQQLILAQREMRLSYAIYVLGFIGIGAAAPGLLHALGSRVVFVDNRIWALLGVGILAERFGSMHLQLYSTTNHIIWHVATGISSGIYLATIALMVPISAVYAFPVALIVSYGGFYSWYAARHVYRLFSIDGFLFERGTSLIPTVVIVLYAIIAFWT